MMRTVAEPLEEEVEASGALVTQTETARTIITIGLVVNVVLEDSLRTVEGETFAKFDDGDQEGGGGKILSHTSQVSLLVLGRLLAIGCLYSSFKTTTADLLLGGRIHTTASDEGTDTVPLVLLRLTLGEGLVHSEVMRLATSSKVRNSARHMKNLLGSHILVVHRHDCRSPVVHGRLDKSLREGDET